MNAYKKLYDGIAPEKSSAEFTEEIIKGRTAHKTKGKGFTAAAIAAAAACAVSVTACAYTWGFGDILRSWFGAEEESLTDMLMQVNAENVITKGENVDIEIAGAAYCDGIGTVFMDITRTDGEVFDLSEYNIPDTNGNPYIYDDGVMATATPDIRFAYQNTSIDIIKPIPGNESSLYTESLPVGVNQYIVKDENPSDNKVTIAACFNIGELTETNAVLHFELSDLTTSRQRITGKEEAIMANGKAKTAYRTEEEKYEELDCGWAGDLGLTFKESEKRVITPKETVSLEFYNQSGDSRRYCDFSLERLTVSNFSVSMELEAPVPDEWLLPFIYDIGEIVFKNGETVEFGNHGLVPYFYKETGNALGNSANYDKWNIKETYLLNEPVDLQQIDYVIIGEKEFKF